MDIDHANKAYQLWLKCVSDKPADWQLTDAELVIVDEFVVECIKIAMETIKNPDS